MNIEQSVADRKPTRKKIGACAGTLVDPFRKREIYYESQLERDHLVRLIAQPNVVEIREQQLVEYTKNGRLSKHYVDFIVELDTGHRIAYFVKPSDEVEKSGLRNEIREIVDGCEESFADEFVILTEQHLDETIVANSMQIIECGKSFDYEAIDAVRACLKTAGATVTPRQVGELTGLNARGSDALLAMLPSGDVRTAITTHISLDTSFNNGVITS